MAKSQISSSSSTPSRSSSVGLHRMDELEKVFARFDADGDGRISASELAAVLRALGSDPSPDEIRDMIAEMDADRDGFVDLQEFAAFHRCGVGRGGAEAELKDAFRMYDLDSDGLISVDELLRVMRSLGEKCTLEDCARMIRSVDSDGDGSVSFEEFKTMMTGGCGGLGSSGRKPAAA
ncbi:probable calcium-binding protein CML18 [Musa acuminata AAA Group]|uniref:probable calcium-binding protein CML18 n=1 Tax=Musa acuminata AAA Group TaxID=214697 RepID=UPI0031E17D53